MYSIPPTTLHVMTVFSCRQGDVVTDDDTIFELAACAMQAQHGEHKRSELLAIY